MADSGIHTAFCITLFGFQTLHDIPTSLQGPLLHSGISSIAIKYRAFTTIKLYCYMTQSKRWTILRSNKVLFLTCDIETTNFNQYLPMVRTSLYVPNSRLQKLVVFWMWRHHAITLWRHGRGARYNALLLTTARNVNCQNFDEDEHVLPFPPYQALARFKRDSAR